MRVIIYFIYFWSLFVFSQDTILPLYEKHIPCSSFDKIESNLTIGEKSKKIKTPQLWYYPSTHPKKEGAAVLVIPGGGYKNLAFEHEGIKVAEWLNKIGISAFVLMYRTPHWESKPCKTKVALLDAQRALQIIAENAKQWNIDSAKIGIIGFSAGGHLAATLSNHFDFISSGKSTDKKSYRPSFCILVYPVISMTDKLTHMGSKYSFMGKSPRDEEVHFFSNELQISAEKTPPTLLIHAIDDAVVIPENSILYHETLQENKIPTRLHLMDKGGHGFGIKNAAAPTNSWLNVTKEWLKDQKIIAH
ncbi:MAG: alpha/beta hydrolase [Flavobacteriaceae bacterium]|nr:alpha/beta hydrolase [Flavobacteriaceae bacterium]MDG1042200.1 alpha/beta hydrolase [Flavobacteriaceae bacterium]MDG1793000.1 alpha/beta hydrolase [Flavobacteriaceae bacterium]